MQRKIGRDLPIILIGLPGSGKSHVGAMLADKLQVPHIDTDDLIIEQSGKSISEIFTDEGEASFRQLEEQAVQQAISVPAVISLGGGAITSERTRHSLRGHTVVFIDADDDELIRRLSGTHTRPLIGSDISHSVHKLRKSRRALYQQAATVTVQTDSHPVENVVRSILNQLNICLPQMPRTEILVHSAGAPPYSVCVGTNILTSELTGHFPHDAHCAFIIHPRSMKTEATDCARKLEDNDISAVLFEHPDSEEGKTLSVAATAWESAAQARLSRRDVIIGFGGGATTDLAGFIAATWLRGINVIHVPTTLLSMVDAAIGGKTGINIPEGKNLVGAFHAPRHVVVDPLFLRTLPLKHIQSGLAEVIKCGFIDDPAILQAIESNVDQVCRADSNILRKLIERAITVKARIVSHDFQESGQREVLNYGHTLAHAIERCEHYQWSHGDAVAVGSIFAAELARDRQLIDDSVVEYHRKVIELVGLPTCYTGATLGELTEAMFMDKKVRGGHLRFVLLNDLGNPNLYTVHPDELTAPARRVGIHV